MSALRSRVYMNDGLGMVCENLVLAQVGAAISECVIELVRQNEIYLSGIPQIAVGELTVDEIDIFLKFDRAEVVFKISQSEAVQAVELMLSRQGYLVGLEKRVRANLAALQS